MPMLSAINIVRQNKEVMRICASHVHSCEESTSSDTQRTHHQRITPTLKANQPKIGIATPMPTTIITMAIVLVALIIMTKWLRKQQTQWQKRRQRTAK